MKNLLQQDTELFLYLNALGNENWDGFWLLVTNKFTWLPLYLILLFFICRIEKKIWKILLIFLSLVLLVSFTDLFTNFCKGYFMRLRPCQEEFIQKSISYRLIGSCASRYGYFSGHASNHFAMATFFTFYFRKYWKFTAMFFFFWAATVAYSRIYLGLHYPLDILTGAAVGVLLGMLMYRKVYVYFYDRLKDILSK